MDGWTHNGNTIAFFSNTIERDPKESGIAAIMAGPKSKSWSNTIQRAVPYNAFGLIESIEILL